MDDHPRAPTAPLVIYDETGTEPVDVITEIFGPLESETRARADAWLRTKLEKGIASLDAGEGRDAEEVFAELDARYAAMERARRA